MSSRFGFGRSGTGAPERDRDRDRNQDNPSNTGKGFLAQLSRTESPVPPPPKGDFILKTNHLTPNGLKVLIYTQELLQEDPELFDLEIQKVDLVAREHQTEEFAALNPNGRIPVLIDKLKEDFPIFESAAILLYLEQHYDRKKSFTYDPKENPKEHSSMIQWVLWAHGNLGPIQSQAHYFRHYCSEEVPFAKQRYLEETQRLYTVMENILKTRDWLVDGPKGFTVADINAYPWVRLHRRAGILSLEQNWPALQAWLGRMETRSGVHAAIQKAAEIGENSGSSMAIYSN